MLISPTSCICYEYQIMDKLQGQVITDSGEKNVISVNKKNLHRDLFTCSVSPIVSVIPVSCRTAINFRETAMWHTSSCPEQS